MVLMAVMTTIFLMMTISKGAAGESQPAPSIRFAHSGRWTGLKKVTVLDLVAESPANETMRKRQSVTRQVGQAVTSMRPPPASTNVASKQDACSCCALLLESMNELQASIRRLIRLFKCYVLRRGPGRPRHAHITDAAKMRASGASWPKVYKTCLPDPSTYDSHEAYQRAQDRLRKAVRLRQSQTRQQLSEPSAIHERVC